MTEDAPSTGSGTPHGRPNDPPAVAPADTTGDRPNDANYTVDFGLFRPQSVGNFVFEDANNNGKLDGGEKGIQGVRVELLDAAGTPITGINTDANGNYSFGGLGVGTYAVRIFPPGSLLPAVGVAGGNSIPSAAPA